ncbi:hypothetical protein [Pseudonocardia yuanmonensis]|uniref:hypothetical protein n=1 Tax=Pseudonocardia yuanmonensis TaxID=1095914 RepID=UPI0031E8C091
MHVVRRRGLQQVLLMLSLIVGVVTMHSTVACHDDTGHARNAAAHLGGSAPTAPIAPPLLAVPAAHTSTAAGDAHVAATTGVAAAESVAGELDDSPGHLTAGSETVLATAAPVLTPVIAPVLALVAPAADLVVGTDLPGQHSALNDVLHLCLAVLTALLAVAAAALLDLLVGRATRRNASPAGGRPVAGPRAPPSTSVRLAQLCVLRN